MSVTSFTYKDRQEPAYLIFKKNSRHKDFIIFKRKLLGELLNSSLGINDLRVAIWLSLQIESNNDYITICTQKIISDALGLSQPAICNSLKNLSLLGIIVKDKLENNVPIWYFKDKQITRRKAKDTVFYQR